MYLLQVCWRTVLSGVGLQFVFGLLILRTTVGFAAVDWLGKQVTVQCTLTRVHVRTHAHTNARYMVPLFSAQSDSVSQRSAIDSSE